MGIHENASSSSLRVESNLSAAPSMYFSGSKRKKLLMSWVVCIKFQGLKTFLIFCFFFSSTREKRKARVKLRKNERFSVFFPPIVDLFDLSKSVPQGWPGRTLAKPTQEWSVINSKGSLALKTELYPKFCLTYTVLGKAKRMISRSWWVLKEKSHQPVVGNHPQPQPDSPLYPSENPRLPNNLPLLTHPSPHLRWANPCQKRFASGSHQRLQNKSRWSR